MVCFQSGVLWSFASFLVLDRVLVALETEPLVAGPFWVVVGSSADALPSLVMSVFVIATFS